MVAIARNTFAPYRAAPFLKWAGGKTQLLEDILAHLPERMRTYYEPFIGGGAVFFALASERRFQSAVIGDQNPELVNVYRVVRDQVNDLIEALAEHARHATDPEYFYEVRAREQGAASAVARAARLIFLNKTCFNGLYRVNRRGQFNVPFGRYANPRVLNEAGLRACAEALRGVDIVEGDFERLASRARAGDGIYFDPPYVPLSATSSFTSYSALPFGPAEQARLDRVYRSCCARGATAVLSNSDCEETRALYRGLEIHTVHATRAINSVAAKRGAVKEVLVVGLEEKRRVDLAAPLDSALPAARARRGARRAG